MSDETIEQEIQRKGLNAPRITPADIEANIIAETCFTAAEGGIGACRTHGDVYQGAGQIHHESLGLLTICVLVLRNGFTVTGESACASPENFDEQIGRKIARENAVQKIWPLMGYGLRNRLAEEATFGASA
ncbi:Gp49 family protein [Pseudomonas sp.]|uniref:Gp49 family protein n=1 Tax=Pseudomonas sp. TaxID=306 RepID=UPI003CC5BBA4